MVHIRRTAHRCSLLRPRCPAIPAHGQPTSRKQILPALHVGPRKDSKPTHTIRVHKIHRFPRIPLITTAQLPWTAAAECGEGRPQFVAPAKEPLCRRLEGRELGRGAGPDWRNVLWNQDPPTGQPHVRYARKYVWRRHGRWQWGCEKGSWRQSAANSRAGLSNCKGERELRRAERITMLRQQRYHTVYPRKLQEITKEFHHSFMDSSS